MAPVQEAGAAAVPDPGPSSARSTSSDDSFEVLDLPEEDAGAAEVPYDPSKYTDEQAGEDVVGECDGGAGDARSPTKDKKTETDVPDKAGILKAALLVQEKSNEGTTEEKKLRCAGRNSGQGGDQKAVLQDHDSTQEGAPLPPRVTNDGGEQHEDSPPCKPSQEDAAKDMDTPPKGGIEEAARLVADKTENSVPNGDDEVEEKKRQRGEDSDLPAQNAQKKTRTSGELNGEAKDGAESKNTKGTAASTKEGDANNNKMNDNTSDEDLVVVPKEEEEKPDLMKQQFGTKVPYAEAAAQASSAPYNLRPREPKVVKTRKNTQVKEVPPVSVKLQKSEKSFDEVAVEFHVLISPDFDFQEDDGDKLYITFGRPLGNFDHLLVEMKPCTESAYANSKKLLYYIGELYLPQKFRAYVIPYKYVVKKSKKRSFFWEYLYCDRSDVFSNRLLCVQDKATEHRQFDDVVCRWHQDKQHLYDKYNRVEGMRETCSRAMISRINANFVKSRGMTFALSAIKQITNRHGGTGMRVKNQYGCYTDLGVGPWAYKKTTILVQFFSTLLKGFEEQKKNETNCEGKLRMALFLCLYSDVLEVAFTSPRVLVDVFETFKEASSNGTTLEEVLKGFTTEDQKQRMATALISSVNKFSYLLDTSKQQVVDKSVWVFALPTVAELGCSALLSKIKTSPDAREFLEHTLLMTDSTAKFPELRLFLLQHLTNDEARRFFLEDEFARQRVLFDPRPLLFRILDLFKDQSHLYGFKPAGDCVEAFFRDGFLKMIQNVVFLLESKGKEENTIDSFIACLNEILAKNCLHLFGHLFIIGETLESLAEDERGKGRRDIQLVFEKNSEEIIHQLLMSHQPMDTNWQLWDRHLVQARKINEGAERTVFNALAEKIESLSPERALACYVAHDGEQSEKMAKLMFDRAVELFRNWKVKQGIFQRAGNMIKEAFFGAKNKENAIRVLEKFIDNTCCKEGEPEDVVRQVTEGDAHQNILGIFPVIGLESLKRNVAEVVEFVAYSFEKFICKLDRREVSLKVWREFSEPERWARIRSISSTCSELIAQDRIQIPDDDWVKQSRTEVESFRDDRDTVSEFVQYLEDEGVDFDVGSVRALLRRHDDDLLYRDMGHICKALCMTEAELANIHWATIWKKKSVVAAKELSKDLASGSEENEDEDEASGEPGLWKGALHKIGNTRRDLTEFVKALSTASVSINRIEKLFGGIANYHKELEVLAEIGGTRKIWVPGISRKVKMLFQLRKIEESAKTIQEICRVLKCKVQSVTLTNILDASSGNAEFGRQNLSVIGEDLLAQGEAFAKWTKEQLLCLQVVTKSEKLLGWVQENIKNLQELKVFVDLASISAGDTDMEVDKILCFQRAMIGYAPLIFEISKAPALLEVIRAAELVFRNLADNRGLPEALRDSNREFMWIKDVSDRHGSVESSTLNTVQQISSQGVLIVSAKMTTSLRRQSTKRDMISLEFEQTQLADGSRQEKIKKRLANDEMLELRSKLMLISVGPESQIAVDHFSLSLAQAETAAKHLENLIQAGCNLFSDFVIKGFLRTDKKVSVQVDFGHKSKPVCLEGKVHEALAEVSNFLEHAMNEWNSYIRRTRDRYSCLNYFTTHQLVLLSSALADKLHRGKTISHEIGMLLRFACPNGSAREFDKALEQLHQSEPTRSPTNAEKIDPVPAPEPSIAETEKEKHRELWNELEEDYGIEEKLLACCLRHFVATGQILDAEKCAEWCQEHEDDFEDFASQGEFFDLAEEEADERDEETSLKNEWTDFMQNINSRGARDFVNFELLAETLQAILGTYGFMPDRKFPKYLQEGRPNLVMCGENELHRMVLEIYRADEEKQLPAPCEVLLCTQETPAEQVDLLCRRAFSDKSGKIFVVAHAHLLNFEIGMQVEELFTNSKMGNPDFRLVFLSSKESSENSYITTAFEKFTVSAPNPSPDRPVSSYLQKYLASTMETSAANFDPDKSRFRLVTSPGAGNGKTLFVKRLCKRSTGLVTVHITKETKKEDITAQWLALQKSETPLIYHMDFASNTKDNDDLIFSIAVLGGLVDNNGSVWMCGKQHLYVAEMKLTEKRKPNAKALTHILPQVQCCSPQKTLQVIKEHQCGGQQLFFDGTVHYQLFDIENSQSARFQRPYQYLSLFKEQNTILEHFTYMEPKDKEYTADCLRILLEYCPMQNPSWAEVNHFTSFLNFQLETTEKSIFCNAEVMSEDLPGMKTFMVRFLVQMSRDFASRSVEVSDESHGDGFSKPAIQDRRKWENTPHPYVFFNEDGQTVSFFGLNIRRNGQSCDLLAERTNEVLEREVMSRALYEGLIRQGVFFNKRFDRLSRQEKLNDLCQVLGVPVSDPDPSYELTYDNVMKMLAIQMRFRSNIPVIIMGETGSGKTRLVRFMCDLQKGQNREENMLILKTHGGVTAEDIHKKVKAAIDRAKINKRKKIWQTVLFFDEANTTNAIGAIKNVMCDRRTNGAMIPDSIGLQFVAAVNPYREHSREMIEKLEKAGLGYHIKAQDTSDRIGEIPLRRLVYRVRELPESLFPLIWDFGTLSESTEKKYIYQMIR